MFARIAGSSLPPVGPAGGESMDPACFSAPPYSAEHQWVAQQRRANGAIGLSEFFADAPDLDMRPARRGGGEARGGGGPRARPPRAAAGGQALRRPPRRSCVTAQPRPALPSKRGQQQQAGAVPVDAQRLWEWLAAASSFAELEGLCSAFAGSGPAFSARHAALAARQLGAVPSSPLDARLLLAERLAGRLAAAAAAGGGGLMPADVAGAVWGLSRVPGYCCEPGLLASLLDVARAAEAGQQHGGAAGGPPREQRRLSGPEVAMLAAGLAGQGLPLPAWLAARGLDLLQREGGGGLGPGDLETLLLAAAHHEQQQEREQQLGAAAALAAAAAGAAGDARALCAAAARACLGRLHEFSPERLAEVVVQLDALGARGQCGELLERAAQLIVRRREEAAPAHGAAAGRRRPPAQLQQGPRAGGAAAAGGRFSALLRHDPALCVLLLREQGGGGGNGGGGGGGAAAFAAG
ncbi:hypothetical protein Rsub_09161 [Raphidocelis subcapitata]|uniref:Uncharacterized protein n=1 Tax=Raphidocelis subcapitata TaxID=307507 RepID=A0A2V0P9P3_9CHLO|nr:hypothetical protein Rsub_09161 [Raphidocelis subcapitata]|eukprot:GBF96578.1 hypothetical protein Rsub_09161 [Raphidocelis subcapitata]